MNITFQGVISLVMQWDVWIALIAGSIIGLVIGAMPGLGPVTAQAILLPLTFRMGPVAGCAFQGAIWASGVYGGSWTAILINVPGTSMSAATSLDGYPLAKKGRALEALGAASMSSFIGGIVGVLILMLLSPVLVDYVVMFGPPEYVWINMLALVIIAVSNKGNLLKGLIAGFMGLILSLIGIDSVLGVPRYTFKTIYLQNGIDFIPVMVGLFGFAEIISMMQQKGTISETGSLSGSLVEGFKQTFIHWKTLIVGVVVGAIVGIIPGIGGSAANLLAYGEAQRRSKEPQTFGKGNIEGVIAAESSNNAIEGTAMIPTLTLGIPGSSSAAILLVVLMMKGFTPGRMLFSGDGNFVMSFFICLLIAQVLMIVVGMIMMKIFSYVTIIPIELLSVAVAAVCVMGVYSINKSIWDVLVAVLFGIIGYFLKKYHFPVVGLVVGLILGSATETAFAQSLAMSGNDYSVFFTRPLSIVLIVFILAILVLPSIRDKYNLKKVGKQNV